jgi:hypothetical protein
MQHLLENSTIGLITQVLLLRMLTAPIPEATCAMEYILCPRITEEHDAQFGPRAAHAPTRLPWEK